MKKKVFFVLNSNIYSGAEKVNFDIIDGLKDKYDFYYVSRRGNINEFLKEKSINWIEIQKMSIGEIRRVVKENKPDIIHATDYTAALFCTLAHTGIPVIAHLHHNAPWIKKISFNSVSFLYAGLKAKKIITVSESIEKEYIFSRFIKRKMINLGNPISRGKILEQVSLKDEKKVYDICCVARITTPKNPRRFIDIISEIKNRKKDLKCVWVGDGELIDDTLKYAKDKNVDDVIEFTGFQKNPYQYMKKSKVFLLTSDWEGFGLVAFEALTIGLPCVVSNVGGLPTIVDDTCGKLCKSNSDFIEEIEKLLSDNKYYYEKSQKAVLKSKKLDNYEEYCNQIDEIYKSIFS